MNFKSYSPEKWVSPEQAVSKIKGGSRVLIGTGAGEPACLIRAMIGNKNLYDIALYQMLGFVAVVGPGQK